MIFAANVGGRRVIGSQQFLCARSGKFRWCASSLTTRKRRRNGLSTTKKKMTSPERRKVADERKGIYIETKALDA